MVERALADYAQAYGMAAIALRYFNAAGADADGEIGESHDPETHLIPLVLDAAAGMRPDITILGDDYDTPDGTCVRDYVHVADIAEAHVRALEKLGAAGLRPAYNLGTGTGISVAEMIDTAKRVTGRDIAVVRGARRAGDPAQLFADAGLVARDLGWVARHSSPANILETAWRWHQRKAW